jgi:drug/metabolite transporter (DMT)-like permease
MENPVSATRRQWQAWVILAVLAVIWGSSFILIKKGLQHFTSDQVGALRISVTFLVMSPFAFPRFRKLSFRDWRYLGLVGIIGSGIPAFFFAIAQTGIDSNLAGILNSLTPLFTVIIGFSLFSLRIRWFNMAGVLIGLAGAIGLISAESGKNFDFNIYYASFIVVATICYALNVNIVKYKLKEIDAVTITVFSFFTIGSPVLLYLLFFTDFTNRLAEQPGAWEGLGYVAILAVVGTGLALVAFNRLVKMTSPVFAASVTYLIPIIAVTWGIADGEIIPPEAFAWMAMILFGVFLVNRKKLFKRSGE